MKLILLLFLTFLNLACGFVARKGYGAKKPKPESRETIEKWLKENKLSETRVVSIAPEIYYDITFGLPQAPLLFENKAGIFLAIGFSNGKYCPKETDKSFASVLPYNLLKEKPDSFLITEKITIPPGGSFNNKETYIIERDTIDLKLNKLLLSFRDLSGNEVSIIDKLNDDYTLLLPFAVFLGSKLQVQELKKFYFSAL